MRRRYEQVCGTAVNVEEHGGDGPTVLLVHGLGGSAGNWTLVAPRLVEHARVVAIDLPGHGRSGPLRRHDLEAHASTVVTMIDRLGGRVALVGNSMGGLVSEMVASSRPDLVDTLLLLSPATPPATIDPAIDPSVAARLLVQSLPAVGTTATRALTMRWEPSRQVAETLRIVMAHPETLPSDVVARAVELARLRRTMPWAHRAFAESLASVRRHLTRRGAFRSMVDSIVTPTTLVFGTEDRVVQPAALRAIARRRADWRAIELPDVGHTPMLERPDLVARELRRLMEDRQARDVPGHPGGRGYSRVSGHHPRSAPASGG